MSRGGATGNAATTTMPTSPENSSALRWTTNASRCRQASHPETAAITGQCPQM